MIRKTVKKRSAKKKDNEPDGNELFETFKMEDSFYGFAGETGEIDWSQLQKLLLVALKEDNQNGLTHTRATHVDAAMPQMPGQTQPQQDMVDNLIKMAINFLCMTVCKDTQAGNDLMPKTEEVPLVHQSHSAQHQQVKSHTGFGNDVCRSMIAMYDTDLSGKMGFNEFKELWTDIIHWVSVFNHCDHDKSESMSGYELRSALASVGYSVNNRTLNLIMIRYGNEGHLELDNFIMSIVKLKFLIQTFQEKDVDKTDKVEFSLDEWLDATIYS